MQFDPNGAGPLVVVIPPSNNQYAVWR
jgi:hypothetical protein